jgi:hypothetical protein
MVVEKLYELPICYEKWKEIFDIEETELYRIWTIVNFHWKPSKMIEVDFKIAHHSIFTNTKLMKMKLIDYEECEICENEIDSLNSFSPIFWYCRLKYIYSFSNIIIITITIYITYHFNNCFVW